MSDAIANGLHELFAAERAVRAGHEALLTLDTLGLLDALEAELSSAQALSDEHESHLRIVRIASLLGDLTGPKTVRLLLQALRSPQSRSREVAGVALERLAFDRFKEVALGVEDALKTFPAGDPALQELPYVLADVPEPGVAKLLDRMLQLSDAEAVCAAIEVIADTGEQSLRSSLQRLKGDNRSVELDNEEGGNPDVVTIGELASEAIDVLMESDDR